MLAAIKGRLAHISSQGIVRATGILVGGTVAGNLITAASLPVVTRLYTPEQMSVLAVFASILQTLYVSICLRFDIALPMPEADEDAVNLLAIGASFCVLLSALTGMVLLFVPHAVYAQYGYPLLADLIWLLPPALALAGLYSLMQMWFVRRKAFGAIARSRLIQSAGSASTQIGLGFAHVGAVGLILGYAFNTGAGSVLLGVRFLRREWDLMKATRLARMRQLFTEYRRFPVFSAPEALAQTAGWQLPIILIAGFAIGPEAGFLTLAMFVIQAPMSLLGNALAQVYLSEAPDKNREGTLGAFTIKIIGGLLKIGVGPLIALGIVSPAAFAFVFGPDWARAGTLVLWLTPWFALQLLVAPVSMALHVTSHQRLALITQLFGLVLRLGLVAGVGLWMPQVISEAYAVSGAIFYLVYLLVVLHVVGARVGDLLGELRKALLPIAAFIVLGIIGAFVAHWLDTIL